MLRHLTLLLFNSTIYTAKLSIKSKSSSTKRLNCKSFVAEVIRTKIEVWVPTGCPISIAISLQSAGALALIQ